MNAPDAMKNNQRIVRMAVAMQGTTLEFASLELRNDFKTVFIAIVRNWTAVSYASEELRAHPMIRALVFARRGKLACLKQMFDQDAELYKALQFDKARKIAPYDYELMDEDANDELPPGLADKSICTRKQALAAVALSGRHIHSVPDALRSRDVVLIATINQNSAFAYSPDKYMNDREFACAAMLLDGDNLEYFSFSVQDTRLVARLAISNNYSSYAYVSERLRGSLRISWLAFKQCGHMLCHAPASVCANRQLVELAVTEAPWALEYADEDLQDDLALVQKVLMVEAEPALEYCSDRLFRRFTKDDALMRKVISTSPVSGLRNASQRLKNNAHVVTEAVRRKYKAFAHASERLKDNETVAYEALAQNLRAKVFLSARLAHDEAFGAKVLFHFHWQVIRVVLLGTAVSSCQLSRITADERSKILSYVVGDAEGSTAMSSLNLVTLPPVLYEKTQSNIRD
tara:strand:- start:1188 stop:2564 length:1377 start_codon:yes stop_codon:yes gene_type:complete